MDIVYATREQVQSSLEIAHTARSNSLVDSKLRASSRSIEGFLHRRFYPELRTIKKDWPNYQYAPTWQVWFDGEDVISADTVISGGTTIPSTDYFLRRGDDLDEPPYSSIEIDLSTSSALSSGDTFQRSLSLKMLFGYNDTDTTVIAAFLGGNIDASVTTAVLNPASGIFDVGVGSLIMIGTERILLTERRMSDTGQNLASTMDDVNSDTVVDVSDGSLFAVGETILIGSERMRIDDIAGNNLIVTRAWDGTVLGTHAALDDVFALRTFTIRRGVLGSTAAAHTAGDFVFSHQYPALVNELCIAETVVLLEQNSAGYARTIGSGNNVREPAGLGLEDIRQRAWMKYCRKSRKAAI